jgi:uncharacterized membrane protein (UPF0127 family)
MRSALTIVLLTAALTACTGSSPAVSPSPAPLDASSTVAFPRIGAVLHVRVANTDPERMQGLMGVTSLPADQGMAFVFDQPTTVEFWMKDTLVPLSIAFVDANGAIVTISEMAPCTAEPCATYPAAAPYVLAIEANAHWFADHGVVVGDHAVFRRAA